MSRLIETRGSRDFKAGQTGVEGKGLAVVIGVEDAEEAYDLAADFFPATVGGIPRGSIDVKDLGSGTDFEIEVDYSSSVRDTGTAGEPPAPPGTGEGSGKGQQEPTGGLDKNMPMSRKYSIATGGGTKSIVKSREVILTVGRNFGAGARAVPDNKGFINVVNGQTGPIDILGPSPNFTIAETANSFTLGYFLTLCRMTGTINDDDWGGFAPGELLFEGAQASNRDGIDTQWDLTWQFKYAPTEYGDETDLESDGFICDGLIVPEKAGWDYLEILYEETVDEAAAVLALRPYAAIVHRVYRSTDFTNLGIT